jgi:hypothetical protein
MARPTIERDPIETARETEQDPEQDPEHPEQTPEQEPRPGQNNRRVSYAVGDPESAPELIRLMNCQIEWPEPYIRELEDTARRQVHCKPRPFRHGTGQNDIPLQPHYRRRSDTP